jgi:hypothetical protein
VTYAAIRGRHHQRLAAGTAQVAQSLIDYYGRPDEYSRRSLTWYKTRDGWKRTVLSSDEVPHDFPTHHTDFLEQFIDYKVPVGTFSRLAEFDGSVIADRTEGRTVGPLRRHLDELRRGQSGARHRHGKAEPPRLGKGTPACTKRIKRRKAALSQTFQFPPSKGDTRIRTRRPYERCMMRSTPESELLLRIRARGRGS